MIEPASNSAPSAHSPSAGMTCAECGRTMAPAEPDYWEVLTAHARDRKPTGRVCESCIGNFTIRCSVCREEAPARLDSPGKIALVCPKEECRKRMFRRQRWAGMIGCLGVLVVLVLGYKGCQWVWSGISGGPGAWQARKAVEKRLKYPGSADFEEWQTVAINEDGSRAIVWILVDSQNGFGAMIRNSFLVYMLKVNDGSWHMVDMEKAGNPPHRGEVEVMIGRGSDGGQWDYPGFGN